MTEGTIDSEPAAEVSLAVSAVRREAGRPLDKGERHCFHGRSLWPGLAQPNRGETVTAARMPALPRRYEISRGTPSNGDSSKEFATLVDLLSARAQARPDHVYFVYLEDGIDESELLTFGDLERKARAIAAGIGDLADPGERAIVVYPPGTAFMASFLGCLYGGIIVVPAPPIGSNRNGAGLARLVSIAESSKARVVLTHSSIVETLSLQLKESRSFDDMTVVCGDLIDQGAPIGWSPPEIGPTLSHICSTRRAPPTHRKGWSSPIVRCSQTWRSSMTPAMDATPTHWLPGFRTSTTWGSPPRCCSRCSPTATGFGLWHPRHS